MLLDGQISDEAAVESTVPDELELSELSDSLDVLVSPEESSDEDDPLPPPPPPQEIIRKLNINIKIRKSILFIFS